MKQPRVLSLLTIPYYKKAIDINLMRLRYAVFDTKKLVLGV